MSNTNTQDVANVTNPVDASKVDGTTVKTQDQIADADIDYKKKFSESSKEALRLLEEQKVKDALLAQAQEEIEALKAKTEGGANYGNNLDAMPGFEGLDDDAKKNLINYTNSIKKGTLEAVYSDPAIAFAKKSYNEQKWNEAFEKVAAKRPELRESRDEFKSKYFKADNVPTNIENLLEDLSKVYLFDKAEAIGAKKALEQAERIDVERAGGGDNTPKAGRSIEDWHRLAQSNPAQFAKLSKEFNADLASKKL